VSVTVRSTSPARASSTNRSESTGGSYAAGTPRAGWDHATGWMRRILADVWQLDLVVVESEFTLVGVNPALDQFKELAGGLRQQAEQDAREHGRALAGRLLSARAA